MPFITSKQHSMQYYLNIVQIRAPNPTILKAEASERIQFIESDSQNGTKSGIHERSVCLEMNETEFLSEGSE